MSCDFMYVFDQVGLRTHCDKLNNICFDKFHKSLFK